MEENWDKQATEELVKLGLSWENARIAVGQISEHRQRAYLQGYEKGRNDNYYETLLRYKPSWTAH